MPTNEQAGKAPAPKPAKVTNTVASLATESDTAAQAQPAAKPARQPRARAAEPAVAEAAATPAQRPATAAKPAQTAKAAKPAEAAQAALSSKPPKAAKAPDAAQVAKAPKVPKVPKASKAPKAEKDNKAPKPPKLRQRQVRDSFTMPEVDFGLIATLKARALAGQRATKKSELLRAGLHALAALDTPALLTVLGLLEPVKIGRPAKGERR